MEQQIKDFLIISDHRINSLIDEIELSNNGAKFYYVIDPYDLQNYLLPRGLRDPEYIKEHDKDNFQINREDFSIERVVAETLALHSVFDSDKDKDAVNWVFVLDEYMHELKKFINILITKDYNHYRKDNLKYFKDKFGSSDASEIAKENDLVKLQNKLAICVSLSLGVVLTAKERLRKLLTDNKLVVNGDELEKAPMPNVFKNSFHEKRPQKHYEKFFNIIRNDKNMGTINNWVDCRAADRLIEINTHLENLFLKGDLEYRHILLFLSSANKMDKLFTNKKIEADLPVINNKKFNFHRNTTQLYYKLLCGTDINMLQALKDNYSTENKDDKNGKNGKNDTLIIAFEDKIAALTNEYASKTILYNHDDYKTELEEARKSKNLADFKILIEKLICRLKEFDAHERDQNFSDITVKIGQYSLFKEFIKSVENLRKLSIETGFDYVRAKGNILPLYFNGIIRNTNAQIVKTAVNYIITLKEKEEILKKIKSFANDTDDFEIDYEKVLVVSFLLQLTTSTTNADYALEVFNEIENAKITDSIDDNLLLSDYKCLMSWLARKINKYKEARDYADEGLKLTKSRDGRFYHSLALINACEAVVNKAEDIFEDNEGFKKIRREENIKLLKYSLNYFIQANKFYCDDKYFKKISHSAQETLKETTKNGEAYAAILLSFWVKDIKEAKIYLKNAFEIMENLLPESDSEVNDLEFLHTKACIFIQRYRLENPDREHLLDAERLLLKIKPKEGKNETREDLRKWVTKELNKTKPY
jgi:hypothetical protein